MTTKPKFKLLTGIGHPELAQRVAEHCGVELVKINTTPFPNGEPYAAVDEHVRGYDAFFIDSLHFQNGDLPIFQAELIADCVKDSARRLTGVFSFVGCSKQDRRTRPREARSLRVLANRISNAGFNRAMLFDLHNSSTAEFFTIPTDLVYLMRLLIEHFQSRHLNMNDVVIVGPDIGSGKRVAAVAKILKTGQIAIVFKVHDDDTKEIDLARSQVLTQTNIRIKNKEAWIFDDMIQGGGTSSIAATLLKKAGAKKVVVAAVHADFVPTLGNKPGTLQRLIECEALDEVIVVDTIPHAETWPAKITLLDPARMIADTIKFLHKDKPLSPLFLKY